MAFVDVCLLGSWLGLGWVLIGSCIFVYFGVSWSLGQGQGSFGVVGILGGRLHAEIKDRVVWCERCSPMHVTSANLSISDIRYQHVS